MSVEFIGRRQLSARRRSLQTPSMLVVVVLLAAVLQAPVTEANFLGAMKHLKAPDKFLDSTKNLGHAVQAGLVQAVDKQNSAVQAVASLGTLKPEDLDKIADGVGQELQSGEADEVVQAFNKVDPKKVAEVLKETDPKDIEDVLKAVSWVHYWENHWQRPALYIALSCVASCVSYAFVRGRIRRWRRGCVILEESDRCLLEMSA